MSINWREMEGIKINNDWLRKNRPKYAIMIRGKAHKKPWGLIWENKGPRSYSRIADAKEYIAKHEPINIHLEWSIVRLR